MNTRIAQKTNIGEYVQMRNGRPVFVGPHVGTRWTGKNVHAANDGGFGGQENLFGLMDAGLERSTDHVSWRDQMDRGSLPAQPLRCVDGVTRNGWYYVNPDGTPGGFLEDREDDSVPTGWIGEGVYLDERSMVLAGSSEGTIIHENVIVLGGSTIEGCVVGSGAGDSVVISNSKLSGAMVVSGVLDRCHIVSEIDDELYPGESGKDDFAFIDLKRSSDTNSHLGLMRNVGVSGPAAIVKSDLENCSVGSLEAHYDDFETEWQQESNHFGIGGAHGVGTRRTLLLGVNAVDSKFEECHVKDAVLDKSIIVRSYGRKLNGGSSGDFMGGTVKPLTRTTMQDSYAFNLTGGYSNINNSYCEDSISSTSDVRDSFLLRTSAHENTVHKSDMFNVKLNRGSSYVGVKLNSTPTKTIVNVPDGVTVSSSGKMEPWTPARAFNAFG